ncbi:hypothetical protein K438DRAFT_1592458, partial [Mycena galopus ATCC 62051]
RLLLNYKQIPYKTTWVNFPDIETVLTAAGAPPTSHAAPKYTLPAIIDGETALSDSRVIAEYLDRTYPTRPVPLLGMEQETAVESVLRLLSPLVVPNVVNHLEERDAAYYVQSRRKMFGKELHEICPPSRRDEMLHVLDVGLTELSDFAGEASREGWIFGKDGPAYEDFELVGWFFWAKIAGLPDLWERIKAHDAKWSRLFTAAEPYMAID